MSRAGLCLVAVLGYPLVGVAQPPPRDAASAAGTGVIRGRITDPGGRPLSRVEVRAASAVGAAGVATTGADGRYEIAALPAGLYTVTAFKPNYVRSTWGEQRMEGPGQRIPLAPGETRDAIDVRLTRAAAITGKILDEFGDPVTDASVSAQRYQYVQGARRLMPSGHSGITNDLGEFRVYGLTPGQYYLSATLRSIQMNVTEASGDRTGYASTFYPGTGSVGDAQRLTAMAGQTVSGITWTLLPTQTARITGTVFDGDGSPLAAGVVTLGPKFPGTGFGTMGYPLQNGGRFALSGVAPGDYVLRANSGGSQDAVSTDLTVTGADITGLQLMVAKPSTIRGRLVFVPSTTSPAPPKPTTIDLGAMRDWALGQPVRSPAHIENDGAFEISLAAGRVQLRAAPRGGGGPNGAAGWRLNRVIVNDLDVGDLGIDVPANGTIENVVVEMTNRSIEVAGRVTDAEGHVVRDCLVVLFAQDPARWTFETRFVAVARPGVDDRFHAQLLAGDYYVVAMSNVEPNAWTDPEFLGAAREHAVRFSIADGETKSIDVPLSPAPVF